MAKQKNKGKNKTNRKNTNMEIGKELSNEKEAVDKKEKEEEMKFPGRK